MSIDRKGLSKRIERAISDNVRHDIYGDMYGIESAVGDIMGLIPVQQPAQPADPLVGELVEALEAISAWCPHKPHAVAPQVAAVRCSECGWLGYADECGPEGECGDGCPGSSVSEITDPADMIEAWQDSEGTMCGKALADAGLIEPHSATEEEAARLELNPGDAVWDLTEAGEALVVARATGKED